MAPQFLIIDGQEFHLEEIGHGHVFGKDCLQLGVYLAAPDGIGFGGAGREECVDLGVRIARAIDEMSTLPDLVGAVVPVYAKNWVGELVEIVDVELVIIVGIDAVQLGWHVLVAQIDFDPDVAKHLLDVLTAALPIFAIWNEVERHTRPHTVSIRHDAGSIHRCNRGIRVSHRRIVGLWTGIKTSGLEVARKRARCGLAIAKKMLSIRKSRPIAWETAWRIAGLLKGGTCVLNSINAIELIMP